MRKIIGIFFLILLVVQGAGGLAHSQARIIGGNQAPPGAYPWMAALVTKNRSIFQGQFCGGMLVGPQWVLTAAHCVEGENKNTFDVWVGLHNLNNPAGAQKRKVIAVYRHPNFRADQYDNLFYDAALILLDKPVTGITPVALASQSTHNDVGSAVRALGWGTTNPVFDSFPSILREVDLEITDLADSQADYQDTLGPSHLAAAVPDFSKDTCSGDSGGPLFRVNGGNHILVGIVSFGDGCAVPDVEGIYTNVLFLRPWITYWLNLTAQPPAKDFKYRSRSISQADRSPSFSDGTFFGRTRAAGHGRTKTYRLRNDGAGMMIVHNSQISNRTFRFFKEPPGVILPGQLPKVQIEFSPRRRGTYTSIVRINSNDPDDPLFWFKIRGKGR